MKEIIQVKSGNLIFDCRTEGEKEHELIIFLHGFPETSYMWKKLMSSVSKNGFYCVAPNLRGYSEGACPEGRKHYALDKLAGDVLNISRFFNKSKFHLVGHDWGGHIAWNLAMMAPERVTQLVIINCPHPIPLLEAFFISFETS